MVVQEEIGNLKEGKTIKLKKLLSSKIRSPNITKVNIKYSYHFIISFRI